MYFLEQKILKPQLILLNIILMPIIVAVIIGVFLSFSTTLLVVLLITVSLYILLTVIFFRNAKTKKYYLMVQDDKIDIVYSNVNKGQGNLELHFDKIVSFTYYKISSIRSWLQLYSYIYPKCVFITYMHNDEEVTEFIGYLDLQDIQDIANHCDKKLVIK